MPPAKPGFDPIANSEAIVVSKNARFTILTDRLIRMELDPDGAFENRPSLVYWYRNFESPDYKVSRNDNWLEIETDYLKIHFYENNRFHWRDLWIELKQSGQIWRYGDVDHQNLGGTIRTLDSSLGKIDLDPGLISRSGWALVDDSQTPIFDENNLPTARNKALAYKDLYFYGYAQDYLAAIKDHQKVSGKPGLLPRWALGNWWSRFWVYSDLDLISLMDDFQHYQIPLSVCIVDMDWHITNPGNQSSGWTGYTWDRELFPDPEGFLAELHQRKLKTALNLHPAEGVHPHEDAYPDMATRIGVDPASNQPIPFDITDPLFVRAYFETLHHPLEAQGVDFWWLDWQQGSNSKILGLDPLFWLNHLHYYDQGKTSQKRPFIFSRWPGLGGQRYPIGFSGDTVVHWKSLAFQPEMTATASNVAYGWWSHDIGGHCEGVEEAELYLRWVQFGVFSPIFRLHSTNNPYIDRRPWGFDGDTLTHARHAMQLRHQLIPLIYTANYINASQSEPLILPMYYRWQREEAAYQSPGQYLFCRQLLVAPVTDPIDPQLGLARKLVWLPKGSWFDFNTHEFFQGDFWYSFYAGLEDIPRFVQSGAIIPIDADPIRNGVDMPTRFLLKIFASKDASFELYEDAGEGTGYLDGEYCITRICQSHRDNQLVIKIEAAKGAYAPSLPQSRQWQFEIVGVSQPGKIVAGDMDCDWTYSAENCTLSINSGFVPSNADLNLVIDGVDLESWQSSPISRVERLVSKMKLPSLVKQNFMSQLPDMLTNPVNMFAMAHNFSKSQLLAIYEAFIPASNEKPVEDIYNAFENMMSQLRKM